MPEKGITDEEVPEEGEENVSERSGVTCISADKLSHHRHPSLRYRSIVLTQFISFVSCR